MGELETNNIREQSCKKCGKAIRNLPLDGFQHIELCLDCLRQVLSSVGFTYSLIENYEMAKRWLLAALLWGNDTKKHDALENLLSKKMCVDCVVNYARILIKLKKHPELCEYPDIATDFDNLSKVVSKLGKRRRGHQGPLSDSDRWMLAIEYSYIFLPFDINSPLAKATLEKYSIPFPEHHKISRISKTEACNRLSQSYGITYEQCAAVLNGLKGELSTAPPSKG